MSGIALTRGRRVALGFVAPALLVGLWQWHSGGTAGVTGLAPPSALFGALRELAANGTLLADVGATLGRALSGFTIGAALGVLTGVLTALFPALNRVIGPLLHAFRQVPMIGWLPLIALWFGAGEGAERIVVCVAAFFPAMLNSHAGVAGVEQRLLDVGRVYGLDLAQRFRLIQLPAALPLITTGLTQALAFAWIATIGSEILMGAGGGLGMTMQQGQMQQRLDVVLVAVAATAALGFAINLILLRLRRALLRWQPVLP